MTPFGTTIERLFNGTDAYIETSGFDDSRMESSTVSRRIGPLSGVVPIVRPEGDVTILTPSQHLELPARTARPVVQGRAAQDRFRALYQWEGTVLDIAGDQFVARTRDLVNSHFPDEQVTLPVDDVPPSDCGLLQVGAVFYWMIGYEETEEGTRKRLSMIRFRRLPSWSRRAIDRIETGADELMRDFGPKK